jgi:hypothetical protein
VVEVSHHSVGEFGWERTRAVFEDVQQPEGLWRPLRGLTVPVPYWRAAAGLSCPIRRLHVLGGHTCSSDRDLDRPHRGPDAFASSQ